MPGSVLTENFNNGDKKNFLGAVHLFILAPPPPPPPRTPPTTRKILFDSLLVVREETVCLALYLLRSSTTAKLANTSSPLPVPPRSCFIHLFPRVICLRLPRDGTRSFFFYCCSIQMVSCVTRIDHVSKWRCVCACMRVCACVPVREREAVTLIHPKPTVGYVQVIHGVCLPEYLFDYTSLCREAVWTHTCMLLLNCIPLGKGMGERTRLLTCSTWRRYQIKSENLGVGLKCPADYVYTDFV